MHQQDSAVTIHGQCQCPICLQTDIDFKHVGLHLQQIALFSLPRSTGLENESEQGSQGSERANLESGISEHDLSDMSEPAHLPENCSLPKDPSEIARTTDEQWFGKKPELRGDDKPYIIGDTEEASKVPLTEEAIAQIQSRSQLDSATCVDGYLESFHGHGAGSNQSDLTSIAAVTGMTLQILGTISPLIHGLSELRARSGDRPI